MGLFGALGGALTAGKSQTALKTINKIGIQAALKDAKLKGFIK